MRSVSHWKNIPVKKSSTLKKTIFLCFQFFVFLALASAASAASVSAASVAQARQYEDDFNTNLGGDLFIDGDDYDYDAR